MLHGVARSTQNALRKCQRRIVEFGEARRKKNEEFVEALKKIEEMKIK